MAKTSEGSDSTRAERSVEAFREALEKSITISRERLQEVVDDAVRRGRMTRGDAEELVNRLVTRGREQADDILSQLESLVRQLGEDVGSRAKEVGEDVGSRAKELGDEVSSRAKRARGRAP